jgi:hypothetical protein
MQAPTAELLVAKSYGEFVGATGFVTTDHKLIKLIAAADGISIADRIAATFEPSPALTLDRDLTSIPDEHLTAVLVFVLTDESLTDPKVQDFARTAEKSGFPIVPVLPKRAAFDFRSLTGDFSYLGRLKLAGWDEGDSPGELVFTAIRRHLGLEPFRRDCRLFISYRRSDGFPQARACGASRGATTWIPAFASWSAMSPPGLRRADPSIAV